MVFSFGKIDDSHQLLYDVCTILNLGLKFSPCLIRNNFEFYSYLLSQIDCGISNFNFDIFINKLKNFNSNQTIDDDLDLVNSTIGDVNDTFESNSDEEDDIRFFNFNRIFEDYLTNKKSYVKRNKQNIPIQRESNELKRKIIKNFANKSNFNPNNINLSDSQIKSLQKFIKIKPFKIAQCDKNVGTILLSNEDYDQLCTQHLSNNSTYEVLNADPLETTINTINSKLIELFNNGNISQKLFKKFKLTGEFKSGNFRILAKIHKSKFGIRPIINSINHPTSLLSEFIDIFLQPLVKNCGTVIKDSQEVLQILENFQINGKKVYLYSCDFESLYTNINPLHATNTICDFLSSSSYRFNLHLDLSGFREIMLLVFNNGIFKFQEQNFKQIIGLPMGCKCGPTVANFYLYLLEKNWLSLNSVSIYKRFIDDILIISTFEIDLDDLEQQFIYLKLNIIKGDTVVFLDLKLSFDPFLSLIKTDLYIKPTNCQPYLLTSSNHPSHIFDNIPTSLFIRIRRICSSFIDYLSNSRNLLIHLLKKGYCYNKISGIARQVGELHRSNLLPYKNKEKNETNTKLKMFFKFDKNLFNFKNIVYDSFFKFKLELDNSDLFKKKNFLFVNNINQNLGSILIHNFKFESKNEKFFCKKCSLLNCKICNFLFESFYLKFYNIYIPIKSNSDCNSVGCVYIIKCKKCNLFYIGETSKNCKTRISQHLNSISRFKKNIVKSLENFESNSEIANHFGRADHGIHDFVFAIFKSNLFDDSIRKSVEAELINLFKCLEIPIINQKIPNYQFIKTLSFIK